MMEKKSVIGNLIDEIDMKECWRIINGDFCVEYFEMVKKIGDIVEEVCRYIYEDIMFGKIRIDYDYMEGGIDIDGYLDYLENIEEMVMRCNNNFDFNKVYMMIDFVKSFVESVRK